MYFFMRIRRFFFKDLYFFYVELMMSGLPLLLFGTLLSMCLIYFVFVVIVFLVVDGILIYFLLC